MVCFFFLCLILVNLCANGPVFHIRTYKSDDVDDYGEEEEEEGQEKRE